MVVVETFILSSIKRAKDQRNHLNFIYSPFLYQSGHSFSVRRSQFYHQLFVRLTLSDRRLTGIYILGKLREILSGSALKGRTREVRDRECVDILLTPDACHSNI